MPTITNRLLITGAAALLAVGVAGCSSDSATVTSTTAASPVASPSASAPTACAAADTAKASLQTLADTEILAQGTDTLKANFATFQTDVQALITSARTDFATESAAVQASVAVLQAAITSLTESPSVADAAAVAAAIKPVQASLSTLVTAVQGAC